MNSQTNSFIVFGANTDVGKTCVSAAFAFAAKIADVSFNYVKPLQTGVENSFEGDAAIIKTCAKKNSQIETLFSWPKPVSPHLASQGEVHSQTVLSQLEQFLNNVTRANSKKPSLTLIETAGGPASPSTDDTLQGHLYRNLNIPAVLVGDNKLGGISTTITAYAFLKACGYRVEAIVIFNSALENHKAIQKSIPDCQLYVLPALDVAETTACWAARIQNLVAPIFENLMTSQLKRAQQAQQMTLSAKQKIWWPFTQHSNVTDVRFIDAAFGDYFHTAECKHFDAIGSWWTMGLKHGDIGLSNALAHAASRYGHVLFPEQVHQPAIQLAEKLLDTAGKGWARKVFYSDNGSTSIEVALKMAFRYRESQTQRRIAWKVVGLSDSYHGDTLAAMDASSPNAFKQFESWYKPRGVWLNAPTLSYQGGVLSVTEHHNVQFQNLNEAFQSQRRQSALAQIYFKEIDEKLKNDTENFGALLIEPLVHGSGGMVLIDPLFQVMLILWCRENQIPVIFDEVFVGLWRLGVPSANSLLGEKPDIACYAKLLTGGVLPLAATLATSEVFQSFLGDSKAQALLHGHSFTAHPIGCAAGTYAMQQYEQTFVTSRIDDYWDESLVREFSNLNFVKRVTAIGSICAVEFKSTDNKGYMSNAMNNFLVFARNKGFSFRPLGNVIYFVVSPLKTKQECTQLLVQFKQLVLEFFK